MRVLVYGLNAMTYGGISSLFLNMSMNIGYDIIFDYVLEEKTCIFQQEFLALGGRIYSIEKRSDYPITNILDNYQLLKKLKNRIDVVYFNLCSLSWIVPIMIARCLGYRVCVHSHMSQFVDRNGDFLHIFAHYINRFLLAHMNVTRLTCSKPASRFMFKPWNTVNMVFNAIKISQFAFNKKIREKVRNELRIQDKHVVGFVGRIEEQKNPLYLIDIFNKLVAKQNDIVMLVVGDGSMCNQFKEKADSFNLTDKIRMLGNRNDVHELLQAMDILLLPSKHEGLPYVLIEAQTAGLQCVVSDSVTKEVDVAGNIKFLPVSSGADVWADVTLDCLKHPFNDRNGFAEVVAASPFNIEKSAQRLEKILRGV